MSIRIYSKKSKQNWGCIEMTIPELKPCPLRAELEKCQHIFAHYADLHSTKGTADGNQKAAINLQHANRITTLLREQPPSIGKPVAYTDGSPSREIEEVISPCVSCGKESGNSVKALEIIDEQILELTMLMNGIVKLSDYKLLQVRDDLQRFQEIRAALTQPEFEVVNVDNIGNVVDRSAARHLSGQGYQVVRAKNIDNPPETV